MNRKLIAGLYASLFLFALTNTVKAADESFTDQFLGSPLLILTAFIVIDIIAFLYHKIRK
jgi:hypothetical protein